MSPADQLFQIVQSCRLQGKILDHIVCSPADSIALDALFQAKTISVELQGVRYQADETVPDGLVPIFQGEENAVGNPDV